MLFIYTKTRFDLVGMQIILPGTYCRPFPHIRQLVNESSRLERLALSLARDNMCLFLLKSFMLIRQLAMNISLAITQPKSTQKSSVRCSQSISFSSISSLRARAAYISGVSSASDDGP